MARAARFLGLPNLQVINRDAHVAVTRGRGGWPTGRAVSSIRVHPSGCGKRNFLTLYFLRGEHTTAVASGESRARQKSHGMVTAVY